MSAAQLLLLPRTSAHAVARRARPSTPPPAPRHLQLVLPLPGTLDPGAVEAEAEALAFRLREQGIPEPRKRGNLKNKWAPMERWGWGPLEVWTIRAGMDAHHRRFFRTQWLRLHAALALAPRPFDAHTRAVEDRAIALLEDLIGA